MVSEIPPSPGDLGFDPEAIRRRYLEESEKRVSQGSAPSQLAAASAVVSDADPFSEPFRRAPLADEVDVAVVGGGFTGLITGAHLRKAGVPLVRIIDKAGGFGGVWYWNRYPGIRCDVDSYVYMPLLEDAGTMPSEKYAHGDEIRAHCQALAEAFSLDETACLQTQVTGMRWDQDASRWLITTDRGDQVRARFVCLGSGTLDRPSIPAVPGLGEFTGRVFHSSRWDYRYTGGDARGGLTGLAGKRVAVVGTAASAIQFIPHLADDAGHVTVFQRTPVIVSPRGNQATDPAWYRSQPPGWQQERTENFTAVTQTPPWQQPPERDLVDDSTTRMMKMARNPPPQLAAALHDTDPRTRALLLNYAAMEKIRAAMAALVDDPPTAEAIKPYYNLGCKRPQFSDDYLQTLNRPNVTLVDTQGRGIERLTAGGVVANGVEYQADCVIFATGFAVSVGNRRAGAFPVTGRDGAALTGKWADGVRSLHGIMTSGFPNLFVVGDITQSAFTLNFTQLLSEQAAYVSTIISRCLDQAIASVDVRPEAEERWAEQVTRRAAGLPRIDLACPPDEIGALIRSGYPGGPLEYIQICRDWLENGFQADLAMERAAEAQQAQRG